MAYNNADQPGSDYGGWWVFWIIVAAIVVLFIIGYFSWWAPVRPAGATTLTPTTSGPTGANHQVPSRPTSPQSSQ